MIRRHGGPKPEQKNPPQKKESYPSFCSECGAQLLWVPVNDIDESVELTCANCGLVHSPILNRKKG